MSVNAFDGVASPNTFWSNIMRRIFKIAFAAANLAFLTTGMAYARVPNDRDRTYQDYRAITREAPLVEQRSAAPPLSFSPHLAPRETGPRFAPEGNGNFSF